MVIKRQRVNVGALVEVEADNTDSVDVNGFTDSIQTVGAKTAKFSNNDVMKANSGLRIGLLQVKINSGLVINNPRTEVAADFVGWVANGTLIDDNETTFVNTTIGVPVAVIDYGSIATRTARLVGELTGIRNEFGATSVLTLQYEISDDNITYTDPVTTNKIWATLSITQTGDMGGNIAISSGIISFNDPNTQSFRYIRILGIQTIVGGGSLKQGKMFQVTEAPTGVSTVTVRVRSSVTLDTPDGSVIIPDQIMNQTETLTFDTELLLTGDGEYVTVEIVSFSNLPISIILSEITSIQEVPA